MPYACPLTADRLRELKDQGWLPCDGAAVERDRYDVLHLAIGECWGAGDKVSTFNVPDLRGYFLRGVDDGAGHDPDAESRIAIQKGGNQGDEVGSFQADQLGTHQHTFQGANYSGPVVPAGSSFFRILSVSPEMLNTEPAGGAETRPRNVYVNFLIWTGEIAQES